MWGSSLEFIYRLRNLLEVQEQNLLFSDEQPFSKMREISYLRERLEAMLVYEGTWETRKHTTLFNQRNAFWWEKRTKDADAIMVIYLLPAFKDFTGSDEELVRVLIQTLQEYVEEQRRKEDEI